MSQRIKSWSDLGFRIEMTGDGSPSLRLLQSLREDRPDGEAMHHSGGAAAETDLIYGSCIRAVFEAVPDAPSFVVVGLGLGYIEMSIARAALERGRSVRAIRSFESLDGLRQLFFSWLVGDSLPEEVASVYDQAVAFVVAGSSLTKADIQRFLRAQFPSLDAVSGSLNRNTEWPLHFDGILYDAFSSKTSPELWEEDFLSDFLEKAASPRAHIATYACKGSLKRALHTQNFEITQKPGFQGKRNSLFARRRG